MKIHLMIAVFTTLVMIAACDKKNDDLVTPLNDFPQVLKFDDEGDGDLEDEDHFSFKLTLNDKQDPSGKELGGTVVPLTENVTVHFEIKEHEGIGHIGDYIKSWKTFYEIDDCTESDDLPMEFDITTGKGSVQFPKGITEVEVEFEIDDSFFDDDVVNEEKRSIVFALTSVDRQSENVVVNAAGEFKYEILDDEAVYGDWELDHKNPEMFTLFKSLFGIVNDDIAALNAEDVDKIEISIEYNEIKIAVELNETEMVTECNETEEKNKTIEIETEIEELNTEGDIEAVGEIEQDNGSVKEFSYKGEYIVNGSSLDLTWEGEYDDNQTQKITLSLVK